MGLFDRFRKKSAKPAEPREKLAKVTKSAKDIATENGEPYISIMSVELDPDDISNGAFELDWNDKFITNLVRAGYQRKPNEDESVIVDRWFQDVCRNVVQENYEQWEANYATIRRSDTQDLGDGKKSVS